jgi:hypothetical protein
VNTCLKSDYIYLDQISVFPSQVNYYFFSRKLKKDDIKACRKKAERLLADAKRIQNSLDNAKGLPKRYRVNNPLVDVKYDNQTRLSYKSSFL